MMSLPTASQVIGIANTLLSQAGVPRTVHGIEQCGSVLFGQLYQALIGTRPPGGGKNEAERCQRVVDAFSEQLSPHVTLDHITGRDLATRDPLTIINLLDIFSVLFHVPTVRRQGRIPPPPSSSTSSDDDKPGPAHCHTHPSNSQSKAEVHQPYIPRPPPPQLTPPPSLSITTLTCSNTSQSDTLPRQEVKGRMTTPTTPPRQMQLLNSPLHHSTPRPHRTTSHFHHHLSSSMMSSPLSELTVTPEPSTTHSISLPLPSISPSSSSSMNTTESEEEREEERSEEHSVTLTSTAGEEEKKEQEEEEKEEGRIGKTSLESKLDSDSSYDTLLPGTHSEEAVRLPLAPQGVEVRREILHSLYQCYLRETEKTTASSTPHKRKKKEKSHRRKVGVRPAGQRHLPNNEKENMTSAVTSELFPLIEACLPICPVSMETVRQLRKKQLHQISQFTKPSSSHPPRVDQEIEAMGRKHTALLETLKKEIDHTHRLRGLEEARAQQRAVRTQLQAKRQAVARARRYYRDYELDLKAKLQKRRTNEEIVFRRVFEDALALVREREREVKKLEEEKRKNQTERLRKELRAMDQYYSDQLSMLAASLAEERENTAVRHKAKTRMTEQLRRELREKLENEVKQLQASLDRDDDVTHFRELDAQKLRLALYHLLTPF